MRLRARTDTNQQQIMDELRKAGISVVDTHCLGKGFGDFVAGWHNRNYIFEVKSCHGKLTSDELDFFATWDGQITMIHSAEEAFKVMMEDEA